MSTVRESILANLKTTLEAITKDHGYNNDIVSVQRWLQRGNPLRQVPCIIITAGPESKNPAPNPLVTCHFTVYLDVYFRQEETSTDPTDKVTNSLLGDIEKALMVDNTRGGYARDTNIQSNIPFETAEGEITAGIVIELDIVYQHQLSNPESSG